MTFPFYHLYQLAVEQRNALVLAIDACVFCGWGITVFAGSIRVSWLQIAAWIIGVGGFYASLAAIAVWSLTNSQAR